MKLEKTNFVKKIDYCKNEIRQMKNHIHKIIHTSSCEKLKNQILNEKIKNEKAI